VGDKKDPSARVLSDGGVSGRQKVWVTKKTPPPAFRATEGDDGRQRVWVNPSARVLSDGGGWWQAESVG
jgi:hypothetical protein